MYYNGVLLVGRSTKDAELKYTRNGKPHARFTIAVDSGYTDPQGNKKTDFIPVTAWNKTAEICGDYLTKGRLILVEGRISVRPYEDAEGNKRTYTDVTASFVRFLDNKKSNSNATDASTASDDDFPPFDDDEPPF